MKKMICADPLGSDNQCPEGFSPDDERDGFSPWILHTEYGVYEVGGMNVYCLERMYNEGPLHYAWSDWELKPRHVARAKRRIETIAQHLKWTDDR